MKAADRLSLIAGAAALLSLLTALASGDPWEFIRLPVTAVVITAALGLLACAAALLARPMIQVIAGAGFLLAALAVLVDLALPVSWALWNASTMSWWGGLALALIGAGLAPRGTESRED